MMNKGQLAGLMKQAQAMQARMQEMQQQLESVEVEGQSGSGAVKVVLTCKHEARRVSIDASLVGSDKDMLEDLVLTAVNKALDEAQKLAADEMNRATNGMMPNIPGLNIPGF